MSAPMCNLDERNYGNTSMYLEIRGNFPNSHFRYENVRCGDPDLYQYWRYSGRYCFFYFSDFLLRIFKKYWPQNLKFGNRKKKIFSKKNRRIVKLKAKYGLPGIVILSPAILSIPLGSFLTVKYYGLRMRNVIWLISGQVVWSLVYTFIYTLPSGLIQ